MAEDNKEDFSAEVVRVAKENFYVNDIASSKDTVEEGIELAPALPEMLKRGGFRLAKFISKPCPELQSIWKMLPA